MQPVPGHPYAFYRIIPRQGGALVDLHCRACGQQVQHPCNCPDPRGAGRWVDLFASQHAHGNDAVARHFGARYHEALRQLRA